MRLKVVAHNVGEMCLKRCSVSVRMYPQDATHSHTLFGSNWLLRKSLAMYESPYTPE